MIVNKFRNKHTFIFSGMKSVYLNDSCVDYRPLCFSIPQPILSSVSIAAVSGLLYSTTSQVFENEEKYIDLEDIQDIHSSVIIECIKENVVHTIQALQSISGIVLPEEHTIEKLCRSNISAEIRSIVVNVTKKVYKPNQSNFSGDIDRVLNELKIGGRFSFVIGDVHMQHTFLKATGLEMRKRRVSRGCYNQIYISNVPCQRGESGTCIYVLSPVRGCIGMAIASHPQGGCIATPIMDILNHFNIRIKGNISKACT